MKKDEYVIFTETNARILKNPSEIQLRRLNPKYVCLKNPKKNQVGSIYLHYWKPDLTNNEILVMSLEEMRERDADTAEFGIINDIYMPEIKEVEKPRAPQLKSEPVVAKKEEKKIHEPINPVHLKAPAKESDENQVKEALKQQLVEINKVLGSSVKVELELENLKEIRKEKEIIKIPKPENPLLFPSPIIKRRAWWKFWGKA